MPFIVLLIYGYFYNDYFGWNSYPKSDAEIICDGIFMLGFLLTLIIEKRNV